ncbi:MAG: copper resistance protein CopC/CopD [Actinobacteria bacterium]|nr:copper resistance protein CopC/CopD [Actinomycetota bacterium]
MKHRWAAVCLATLAALVALAPATPAFAHASFEASDPIDGTVLDRAPSQVSLDFSEEVLAEASTVTLLSLGTERSDNLVVRSGADDSVLTVTLPALAKGAYILRFSVVDPADLHRTVGSISFGVGVAAPPSVDAEQIGDSSWSSLLRGLCDIALLMGGGAALLLVLIRRTDTGALTRARVVTITRYSAIALAVGWIALLLVDAATVGWGSIRWFELLTGSDPGRRALIGSQLAIGAWFGGRMLQRAADDRSQHFLLRVVGACWAWFVVPAATGGHAGVGGNALVGLALRAAHLGALCTWVGTVGVAWLVTRRNDDHGGRLWKPVSRCAAIGLALTGLTGLLLAGRTVATITALFSTDYGRVLLVKVAALGLLAVAGLLAAERVAQHRSPHGRLLGAELVLVLAVVVVAGFLTGRAPAVGEQFTPLVDVPPQVVTADLADLTASASVEPAQPGANLLQLRLLDTRRPAPGPIGTVTVKVIDASGATVSELTGTPQNGVVEWDSLRLPSPGRYRLEATIERAALAVPTFQGTLAVSAAPVPRAHTVVSDQDLGPWVLWLAMGWAVLVLAAARFVRSAQ